MCTTGTYPRAASATRRRSFAALGQPDRRTMACLGHPTVALSIQWTCLDNDTALSVAKNVGLRVDRIMLVLRSAVVWVMLLHLTGCAGTTGGNVTDIEVGMSQNQVISILGQPRMREAYGETEFLFYTGSTGNSIPIAIVGGRVTSIGQAAYDIVVRSSAQSNGTSPRAKNAN